MRSSWRTDVVQYPRFLLVPNKEIRAHLLAVGGQKKKLMADVASAKTSTANVKSEDATRRESAFPVQQKQVARQAADRMCRDTLLTEGYISAGGERGGVGGERRGEWRVTVRSGVGRKEEGREQRKVQGRVMTRRTISTTRRTTSKNEMSECDAMQLGRGGGIRPPCSEGNLYIVLTYMTTRSPQQMTPV